MKFDFKKVLLLLILCLVLPLQAQSVKELESQRKQALKVLETTNKMLNETKKSQKSSLTKLTIINKNINERKSLIKNISTEIVALDSEVTRLNQEKKVLESQLTKLKKDYARMVQEAHTNRSIYAKIMFILSAETFDQSYRRIRYLQEFQEYRKSQVRKIEGVKVQIISKSDSLVRNKNTKVVVVKQKEAETVKLSKDEKIVKVQLTDLKKKESKLRADLKIQQKKAADLNNKIANIIAAEIKKAEAKRNAEKQQQILTQKAIEAKKAADAKRAEEQRKRIAAEKAEEIRRLAEEKSKTTNSKEAKAEVKAAVKAEEIAKAEAKEAASEASKAEEIAEKEAKTPAKSTAVSALTKEETLISGNFAANRGRLPWPTSNGYISGHYGVQAHPVLKHVTTNNKGIYVQTPARSNARAVFEGTVTQRFSIPGTNNAVIIQHGEFRTVYANLTEIYVNVGDKVSAKQSIGRIFTDSDNDNKTELYFQIWQGRGLLNPESWIAK
jgi:septal ring factor EnvC (AmiA/AmiB activator)